MLGGRPGLAVDTDLRDEPLALVVPVVDDRRSQLDAVGDDQAGHVRQDVPLEKRHVVTAVGLDLGVEPQPAVHEFGDGLHHEPVHAATAGAVHPNAVLPPGHVAHRLDRPVPVRVPGNNHVIARSLVENDADSPFPWRFAVRTTQPSSGRVNVKARPGSEIETTSSSSVTRLFRFCSPEKMTVGSVAPAAPDAIVGMRIEAMMTALIVAAP
jgi:hypothetical protein